MESISNRLSALFNKLKTTELVLTKNASSTNMEQFCKILNMAVPITTEEMASQETIKFLHRADRLAFIRYIHIIKKVHLVLLTDGGPISNVLGLKEVISIKWDKQKNEFNVFILKNKLNNALNIVNNPDTDLNTDIDTDLDNELLAISKQRYRGRRGLKLDKEPKKATVRREKLDFGGVVVDKSDKNPFDVEGFSGKWADMLDTF